MVDYDGAEGGEGARCVGQGGEGGVGLADPVGAGVEGDVVYGVGWVGGGGLGGGDLFAE